MRIALIAFSNLEFLPYVDRYIDTLNHLEVNLDVIYWSREKISFKEKKNREIKGEYIVFENFSNLNKKKYQKIFDFYQYRKFLIENINNNKYDKLIILSTMPGMIIYDFLLKNYSNKFILDIRDPSYENNPMFKLILKKLISKASLVPISSPGYLNFLPSIKNKYIVTHNFNEKNSMRINIRNKNKNKIKIAFLGFLRHERINIKLINALKNDKRFEIYYYGYLNSFAGEKIKKNISENKINNVHFMGYYDEKNKGELIRENDIIHNLYENNQTKFALGNKLYDGALYKVPQIVTKGSIMSEYVDKYGLGLSIDENEISADQIYTWYLNHNSNVFSKNCDDFINTITNEENEFEKLLRKKIIEGSCEK